MKAVIPFHRRSSNTSAALETLTKKEKIAGPEGMIPTFPPKDGRNEGMYGRNDGGDEPTPYQ